MSSRASEYLSHTSRRTFVLGIASAASPLTAQAPRTVQTVTGMRSAGELGVTLMHEHVVTDLRAPAERSPGDYDREDAVRESRPYLHAAMAAGVRTLVEPTPIWIGRDARALETLARETGLNIICATGIYGAAGQKFIPTFAQEETAQQLADRYIEEYERGIGRSGIRPGIIKTGVNPATPLPAIERKLVRAAGMASRATGLTMASHSGPAAPVEEQLGILDEIQSPPQSFIWVHAQNERDHRKRRELAGRGVWVELDGISSKTADWHMECVKDLAYGGFLGRTLISQDAGWYRPGGERASKYRGYGFLLKTFVPMLRQAGFSQPEVDRLLIANPATALAG